jgi:cell division septum initiation protein DivIVA
MSLSTQIAKEVRKEVGPTLEQIERLRQQVKHKENTLKDLEQDLEEKERGIETLNANAQAALNNGEDPRQYLQQASRIKEEAEELRRFIEGSKSSGVDEGQKIEQLQATLKSRTKAAVNDSKAKQDQGKVFLKALREAAQAVTDFEDSIQQAYVGIGLDTPPRFKLLGFEENSEEMRLVERIRSVSHKFYDRF